MHLRKLELKDAHLMLEWMHDSRVTTNLRSDFSSKTLEDVKSFIQSSWNDKNNINYAIASCEDEYMGTVSLKHIKDGNAEFAIVVRFEAMGKGYSWFGMESIIERAFTEYGLERIYWCVSRENKRAIRFYDKHSFLESPDIPNDILSRYKGIKNLKWYCARKNDEERIPQFVAGCKILHIKTVPTINAGELSFFEGGRELPFDIKRFYYISKVPEGVKRGFHAHKELRQLIFCPYGRILLSLENKNGREEFELNDPSVGVLIEPCTWREMLWLQKDSILCVAASDFYKADDYIRDYKEFNKYINKA